MRRALVLMWVSASAVASAEPLSFQTYLQEVARANPSLLAQRQLVPVSEAQVVLARVFPDPVVTAGLASLDVSGVGAQNTVSASVSVPLEWPGKRSGRLAVAEANLSVAGAELEDAARTVRLGAALRYIDAVSARRVYTFKAAAAQSLAKVVALNERRQLEGASPEISVLQARVESRRYQGELLAAEAEVRATRLALQEEMGQPLAGSGERSPVEEALPRAGGSIDVEALVARALSSRPDLRVRERTLAAAAAQLELARASRVPDVAVGLGWQYYTAGASGGSFQAPPYHTVSALLSVPLPFSKLSDAEPRVARAQQSVASSQREAATLRVESEVRAAAIRAQAARERLAQFDQAVLKDGDRLLEMARYAYEQGAARLVELLSAQRSWVDLHLAYEAALADEARASVILEAAVGGPSTRP